VIGLINYTTLPITKCRVPGGFVRRQKFKHKVNISIEARLYVGAAKR
jgi:hypothetical protein